MRYMKSNVPDILIAAVHAWSDSADGDGIGAPYMFLNWMEGRTLEWNTDFPPEPVRNKVLAQLARYNLDLINRTSKESVSQSAWAFMLQRIDGKLRRILKGDLAHFDFIDGLIYRSMTEEKYHVSKRDTLPFPMMHTDLSKSDIIVDDGLNITGILDWDDWATRVPMQCAVMCPIMIAAVNDSSDKPLFRKDRLTFIDHFTSSLATSGFRADIAARLPSILADEELQIFHASLSSKTVYVDWMKRYCNRSDKWVQAASRALDKFVSLINI